MKKLLIILALISAGFFLKGQSSTINDMGTYISVQYDHGDTVEIPKGMFVVETPSDQDVVWITAMQDRTGRAHRPYIVLDPTDFGYSTANALRDYVANIFYCTYFEQFSYNSDFHTDTVSYSYISDTDTTLQWIEVYGWDSDTLDNITIIPQ